MDIIKTLEQEQLRTDLNAVAIGDHVRLHLKVRKAAGRGSGIRGNCHRKERLGLKAFT